MTARILGWLSILWTLALFAIIAALACFGQGQGNIGGILYASNFTGWSVGQGNNGNYGWTSPTFCTVSAGGITFNAFTVGIPVYLSDSSNPSTSEVVTPTAVVINNSGCSIRINPTYQHQTFYFRTATAGLGEAIGYANNQHFMVILTPQWQQLGGLTSMITSSIGNTNVSILDERTSVIVPYLWNGSAYVATPFAGGGPSGPAGGALNGTYPNPGFLNLTQSAATTFFSGLTGCATAGWVFSPQSGTCIAQSGAVGSVSNNDSTLVISPTTGAVVASLNLTHANTWTGPQTFAGISVTSIIDTGITPSTLPVCPNGAGGAFTTSGCSGAGGGLSGMTAGQIPVAATSTTVTSSIPTTGTGNVVLSASPALTGTPTAPTQGCGSSTALATLAYVANCGTGASLTGMTAGQIPVAASPTTVTSSLPTTGSGSVVRATSPTIATPQLQSPVITTLITGPGAFGVDNSGNVTGASFTSAGPATGLAGLGTATFTLGSSSQVGTSATSPTCSSSVVCDSFSGTFGFTTGTGSLSTGTIVTVNVPGTRTNVPTCIVTVRAGSTFLSEDATAVNSGGTVTIPITVGVALSASTAYHLKYLCDGL